MNSTNKGEVQRIWETRRRSIPFRIGIGKSLPRASGYHPARESDLSEEVAEVLKAEDISEAGKKEKSVFPVD